MARIDQKEAPYYGFIHDEDYSQLLYKPGMHIQAGELNEQQLISSKHLRDIADTVLTDGDIIEGSQIIINLNKKTVTVTPGKIYLEGKIRHFKEQSIAIKGIGIELIGVKIFESIIDSNKDKSLLSIAAGFENYGLEGADRLKQEAILTVNDEEASTIYMLKDGNLVNDVVNTDTTLIDRFNATLARRTYDESGHYKVWGLELSQKEQYEDEHLYLSLSEGKAYVMGWEIEKQSATTIPLERSKDLREIIAEPKTYNRSSNRYALNNSPVKSIKRVLSTVSVTIDMTRQGAVNGSDPIQQQYNPVVDIQEIKTKGTSKVYRKNVDYQLEGNSVRWLVGGEQPDLGSTYTIKFTYNKVMTPDADYRLTNENGIYYLELLSGDKPVDNSQMQIDYDFYLCYMASITLDKDGIVRTVRGQSNTLINIAPPDISDQSVLLIGHAIVQPVNDRLIINNSRNLRTSMAEIINMAERLSDMEVNQAITDLDEEAMEGEEPTLLKGIFTDGFLGFTKSDINHAEYDASIDLSRNELTLGYEESVQGLDVDEARTVNARAYTRLITAKSTDVKSDYQPYATEAFKINPYTAFEGSPHINLNPSVDNWIDTNNIVLEKDGGTRIEIRNIAPQTTLKTVGSRKDERSVVTGTIESDGGTVTQKATSTKVLNSAIEYMRQRTISFEASGFSAKQGGIELFFNDIKVNTTPSSLQANSDGVVKGTFKVPANIRCGSVNVKIYAKDLPSYVGSTTYTSNGQIKTTITTNTTTRVQTVYRQQTITRYVDPVSQTFSLEKDHVLNSIGLYFSDIERSKPVRVQIRECDNGYPSNVVIGETILPQSRINVSARADVESIVQFDNPIYLKKDTQYAFTVLTTSNKSSLWVQDLNARDVTSGEIISKNPYVPGMMFSSSNALAWTTHQSKNIKFNLYVNDYVNKSTIYFNDLKNINYDSFKILGDTSVPIDTSLTWEYSSDNNKTWNPCSLNQLLELNKSIDNISIRANMEALNNVSPTIALDSLLMIGYKYKQKSNYISKNVKTDSNFTNVKIIADVDTPSGTGVVFYYATDINGKDWKTLRQVGEAKPKIIGSYSEYTYTADVSSAKDFRVKVALSTNNTTIRPTVKNLKCIIK